MQGRYTTIVADYSDLMASSGSIDYMPSLCDFGIFGTSYVRDQTVPSSLEVSANSLQSIEIQHIYSEREIGNELLIKMRQKIDQELDFVSLVE